VDTDDVSEDVDEQVEEKEQKQEKQEQTNQRIDNQKAYLNEVIETQEHWQNTFTKKDLDNDSTLKYMNEQIQKDYDQNKKDLANVQKDIDNESKNMPVIPMGENTHQAKFNDYGFNDTDSKGNKIATVKLTSRIQKMVDDETGIYGSAGTSASLQLDSIRSAWNALPDDQRVLVKDFKINVLSASDMNSSEYDAGSVDMKGLLKMTINPYDVDFKGKFNTLHHEIGHKQYSKLKQNSPDKIKKFNKAVNDAQKSGSLNEYVGSYRESGKQEHKRNATKLRKLETEWKASSPSQRKQYQEWHDEEHRVLTHNVNINETIYEDETHSALAQLVTGTNTSEVNPKLKSKDMKNLFNAYKDLHGL